MSNPETVILAINSNAEQLHQEGVRLTSTQGLHEEALEYFGEAHRELGSVTMDDPSAVLQRSRISRDALFTQARIGIRNDNVGTVLESYNELIIVTSVAEEAIRSTGEKQLAPDSLLYAKSEIGSSISILARLATVTFVMDIGQALPPRLASDHYADAARVLRMGKNRYYAASNAMSAARHERITGHPIDSVKWLGQAGKNVVAAAMNDRTNTKPAVKTLVSRTAHLAAPAKARASVLRKP